MSQRINSLKKDVTKEDVPNKKPDLSKYYLIKCICGWEIGLPIEGGPEPPEECFECYKKIEWTDF